MPPTPTLTGQDIAEAQEALAALLDEILQPSGTTPVEYIALRVLALRGPVETPDCLDRPVPELEQPFAVLVGHLLADVERRRPSCGVVHPGEGRTEVFVETVRRTVRCRREGDLRGEVPRNHAGCNRDQ